MQAGKVLSLPGTPQAVDELRLLFAADLFILTDDVAVEKVTNGIVTRAVTSWISDREHVRQVEVLPWIAKELDGWDSGTYLPLVTAICWDAVFACGVCGTLLFV
jgi:hypothetical protein